MTVLAARYELLDKVGEGGMSVVWRARDRKLDREVAIKMLRSLVAPDPAQLRRFHREARALAALAHGHIVRIYDYISNDEQSFLVMEYVDGANLAQTTRGRLPLATGEAAAYMRPVAQALAYAHGRGVVHRDLTPSNILVERGSGRVVTTDFGLARIARSTGSLTATGVLLGTPEYWSPELALGRENGAAADLYALGCILFLLLSGRLPFEGEDRLAVGLRRAHDDAPSLQSLLPDARATVAALVDSLLARDPERRPDASNVAEELGALADASTAFLGVAVGASAVDEQTVALLSEQPTTHLARPSATTDPAPPPEAQPASTRRRSWVRRRVVIGLAASAAVVVAALVVAGEVRNPLLRVPNVVSLREDAARAQIEGSMPAAAVSVERVYSTRIGAGLVIRQQPQARSPFPIGTQVRLVVSKGSPYAPVPAVAGRPAEAAKASLVRQGFTSRYAYAPSWTVRKGSVVGLQPRVGTRLRRPAQVTLVVASGYPHSVVPDVRGTDLPSAQQQLAAKHLRYRLVASHRGTAGARARPDSRSRNDGLSGSADPTDGHAHVALGQALRRLEQRRLRKRPFHGARALADPVPADGQRLRPRVRSVQLGRRRRVRRSQLLREPRRFPRHVHQRRWRRQLPAYCAPVRRHALVRRGRRPQVTPTGGDLA